LAKTLEEFAVWAVQIGVSLLLIVGVFMDRSAGQKLHTLDATHLTHGASLKARASCSRDFALLAQIGQNL
jgi:hypothetical protein